MVDDAGMQIKDLDGACSDEESWSVISGSRIKSDEGQGEKRSTALDSLPPCESAKRSGTCWRWVDSVSSTSLRVSAGVSGRIDPTWKTGSYTQKPVAHRFGAHEYSISSFVSGAAKLKNGIHELGDKR